MCGVDADSAGDADSASAPAPSLLSLPPEFMLPQRLSLFLDCCFGLSLYGASAPGPSLLSASAPAPSLLSASAPGPSLLSLATQLQSGLGGYVVLWYLKGSPERPRILKKRRELFSETCSET